MRVFSSVSAAVVCAAWAGGAWAQLRVVNYNVAEVRTGFTTIFDAIATEARAGIARRPDVLALQENSNVASATESIRTTLNTLYGITSYARGNLDVGSSGAGRPTVVYNSSTLQLISEVGVATVSGSGAARQTLRVQFRPKDYTAAADFYVYISHFKASDTTTDANRRGVEAAEIRANADALGASAHIIYTGDLNLYDSSTEPAWTNLTAAGNGQAFDPVNRVGNWADNNSFKDVHTQSPATVSAYGGQVLGGMDNRFDFQLVTNDFQDNEGLSYVPGTYRAFGNNGTHNLNNPITSGTGAAPAVLTALTTSSDHIPVIADYQIPARMTVSTVSFSGSRILRNAVATAQLTVTNSAAVTVAAGADELDFNANGTGSVTGSLTDIAQPLGPARTVSFPLTTSTAGNRTGSITVTPTSQGVPDAAVNRTLAYTVVDTSNVSFTAGTDTNSLSVDFGPVRIGTPQTRTVTVHGLANVSGFTSDAALTQVRARQEGTLGITLTGTGITNLLAGSSANITATANTASAATYDVSYQLVWADSANTFGGLATQTPLNLVTSVKVVSAASLLQPPLLSLLSDNPRIEGPWTPDPMPAISLVEPLETGSIDIAGDAFCPGRTELRVSLVGTEAAIAHAASDWTIDGQWFGGYTATRLGNDVVLLFNQSMPAGAIFDWNLTGTGARVAGLAVIPEPASLGLLGIPLLLSRRRRGR
jgi:exonuclease III